ncbi:MAG: type III-B CRISPR module RAMP protein Cmr1 [Candidatus Spyradosoma sp.]
MKRYDIRLTLVTPCISRGGDDGNAEFRAPSIRGVLRHWFRALGGTKDREKEIFGGLGKKQGEERASKILVRVKKEPAEKSTGTPSEIAGAQYDYFLGLWRSADEKAYFPADQEAEIQIIDKTESPDFEAALKAFLFLGAIGSRSRRTYGSIYPKSVSCDGNPWTEIPKTQAEFQEYLKNSGLKNAVVLALGDAVASAPAAVGRAKEFLRGFRCGSPKSGQPSRWGKIEHDLIFRSATNVYRPALGLPLIQRYSQPPRGTFQFSFGQSSRWASPLFLKIVPLDGKFLPVAIFLKDFIPPAKTRVARGRDELPLSHELIDTMMNPDQTDVELSFKPVLLHSA